MSDALRVHGSRMLMWLGRSTMAEGIFRSLTKSHPRLGLVDSAGTSHYNIGLDPDERTMATLEQNGIVDYHHTGRQICAADLTDFDYVLAMDTRNLQDLLRLKCEMAEEYSATKFGRIMLFGDFGGRPGEKVVDPFYGGVDGFEIAYEQLHRFSQGFIRKVLDQTEKLPD